MALFANIERDEPATCYGCGANWNVEFLLVDIGRARLRYAGFTFLWFDGEISLNTCPHCELPITSREIFAVFDHYHAGADTIAATV